MRDLDPSPWERKKSLWMSVCLVRLCSWKLRELFSLVLSDYSSSSFFLMVVMGKLINLKLWFWAFRLALIAIVCLEVKLKIKLNFRLKCVIFCENWMICPADWRAKNRCDVKIAHLMISNHTPFWTKITNVVIIIFLKRISFIHRSQEKHHTKEFRFQI